MSVSVVNRARVRIPGDRVHRVARRILRELIRRRKGKFRAYDLAIVLLGNREAGALHERFFRKPEPASVLSFDYGSSGEIIFAPGVIRREARGARTSFEAHLFRLMIHGAVHLAGIHHENGRATAAKADHWEAAIAERLGLNDPVTASSPARHGRGRKIHAHHIRRH